MKDKCEDCKFFAIGVIDSDGEKYPHCRRYALQMISGSGSGWSGQLFPIVKLDMWCGEFKQKNNIDK